MGAGVPEELENDSYAILSEVFAAIPDITKGNFSKVLHIPGLRELILRLSGFDIQNIPNSLWNMTPTMFNMAYKKYIMPLMKRVTTMSKKKNSKNALNGFMPFFQGMAPMAPMMPMMPMFPFMPMNNNWGWNGSKKSKDDENAWMDDFKSNMNTFWEQMLDMQKSSMETTKEQWNQFFEHMMEMQDTFISSLPDEAPNGPASSIFSMSPKEFMKWMKEFQEMSNDHFVEQADAVADYDLKKKEQIFDMVSAGLENAEEEKAEKAEKAEAEEEKAESKAEAKTVKAEAKPTRAASGKEKPAK